MFPFVPLLPSRKNKTLQELLGYTDELVRQYVTRLQQLGLPEDFAEIFCSLNAYTDIVEHCAEGGTEYDACLLADRRNACQHALVSFLPMSQAHNNSSLRTQEMIHKACRLACLVYGAGVILPLPGQSTPLGELAEQIQDVLQSPKDHTIWDNRQTAVTLLWVLTLGGIAAEGFASRHWYVLQLNRAMTYNQIGSWPNLRSKLELIVWYPRACDKAGRGLWAESQI